MTAVEWFFRWFNDNPEATHKEYAEAFKQALEMEKQQLEKEFERGFTKCADTLQFILDKGLTNNYKTNNP
jgi:hypothetical protein